MVRYQLAVGLQKGHKVTKIEGSRKDRPSRRKGVKDKLKFKYICLYVSLSVNDSISQCVYNFIPSLPTGLIVDIARLSLSV